MSVLFETSLGDIVIDLEVDNCPKTCENFLKLCKVYYYNLNAFFNVSKDFLAQAGDPTATGTGGESIWSLIASETSSSTKPESSVPRYFPPEIVPKLKHTQRGTVSMAVAPALEGQKGGGGSQFFITLADNIDYLDGKHAVFGHVVEGFDTLDKINEVYVDQDGRPFKDIRIRHVIILDDPFPDPPGLVKPPSSPIRPPDNSTRIAEDEDPLATLPEEEEERIRREKAAAASALTLEMVGDLPFANVRPPENVLFVCKLNPVTRDEDLELIFSRFGTIMSCQVIRDKKTGDSLQYAFIEFDKREDAEQAYFKMQNVLVDDRRIWVDFSQSVSRLNTQWSNDIVRGPKRGQVPSGFAGREDLEETRRYRNQATHHHHQKHGGDYGLVFDVPPDQNGHGSDRGERRKKRSRSREKDSSRERRRRRSKSPPRHPTSKYKESERDSHRDRNRGYERDRRTRSRSRDGRSGRDGRY
ncbi:cyclophilin-like domain-containing protein [Gymnopilus junonius]|uniref:Peptidyl-prolyl cis-trans isomerase n=1 Tax=Gymnopilus junonius TaxID=109634 RepID=A0A9P5TJP1_GYMJU|nr:cyclophilin-like domain-containing protein [Gymnopilus junonius]